MFATNITVSISTVPGIQVRMLEGEGQHILHLKGFLI